MAEHDFWEDLVNSGLISGDPTYYSEGRAQEGEYANAIQTAFNATQPGTPERVKLIDRLIADGVVQGDPQYWYDNTQQTLGSDFGNLGDAAEDFFGGGGEGGDTTTAAPNIDNTPQRTGTETVGDTVIPTGLRLIRITDPAGTDAGTLFVLVGDVFGVGTAYEVGDFNRLNELFGGVDSFDSVTTQTQAQFDQSDVLVVGAVDEIVGSTESLQAQAERDLRALGLENPPQWLQNDRAAMLTFITGTNEGWSAERTWGALSGFDSFKNRFQGLDVVMAQLGSTSITEGTDAFLGREDQIRTLILANRGPSADISQQYITSLIGAGWQPDEVGQLLGLEQRVKNNPGAIDNINEILAFQGIEPLSADDFVSFLQDQDALSLDPSHTPGEVFEGINDALRFQALITEGIEISTELATELGTGVSTGIASEEQFSGQAQLAAGFIARNNLELDFDKLGLTREDIVSASFGESPEGGKTVSEVNQILEQFGRERSKAAQGFSGSQSFIDASGRLRTQGFADFG